jgi:class 3 adenylate cyclase
MRIAGVKAVALDVLYAEPQDPPSQAIHATTEPATEPTTQPAAPGNDAALARAIRDLGCVVVPESLSFDLPQQSSLLQKMLEQLRADPEMDEDELRRRVGADVATDPQAAVRFGDLFLEARKTAMYRRIEREAGGVSRESLVDSILQKNAEWLSPATRLFDQQYDRWDAISALERLGAALPSGAPPMVSATMQLPPIPVLAHAARATGFVDYRTGRDGILRSVPLIANLDGHVMPQMGLSLALTTLGLSPRDLQISRNSIVIPRADGRRISIPVHDEYSPAQGRTISSVLDIPWFGGSEWQTMYDWPALRRSAQHLSITAIWDACDTQRKIAKNNSIALDALRELRQNWGLEFVDTPFEVSKADALQAQSVAAQTALGDYEKGYGELKPEEIDERGAGLLNALKVLRIVREQNALLAVHLHDQRAFLAGQLGGKSVLVGWIASGQIDVTPTSIHPKCPGVIAHGVIFNAIMTGDFWRRAPFEVTLVATFGLGLLAMLLATWTSPFLGLLLTLMLGGGYALFNGYFLFDKSHVISGLAGPLLVLAFVWAGCTLNRIIIESSERARITRRFSTYADPTLVRHVLEHPDQVRLDGETRELSVVFTDLAGFTTISERLGEQTVSLLNEYFGKMVPLIQAQKGYVNKFLGDGIMFFFGAPIPASNHALQAMQSVSEMRVAFEQFNEDLQRRGLPRLVMRAGISTGLMVVGDAGTTERSDYTVIGDLVNFASRLEGANKATGTRTLINDRTAELVRDRFLLRPIGRLQVVGKEISVMTYEPVAPIEQATEQQKQWVQMTTRMVDAYIAADFAGCRSAADALEASFGPSPLVNIYRAHSLHAAERPSELFDGRIELKEK